MKKIRFEWKQFSNKQLKLLTWWCDNSPVKNYEGIIAVGAVRSGKTITMAPSFINWAMERFEGQDFAMCGKTISSLRRNVINTLKKQLLSLGYTVDDKRSENLLTVTKGDKYNYFYLFGGKDESSQDLIQGMTLAGVLFDEVALMPQSFVQQAEARCSVENSKLWYNCNPKSPKHYFYKEYIENQMYKSKNLLYLHFTMDDNLTLSEKMKNRYKQMFSGVFYQRNILGLWVTAEGKIYGSLTRDNIIPKKDWYTRGKSGAYINPLRKKLTVGTIGVDFGGTKSATAFVCTVYTRALQEMIIVKEKRITKEITPDQLNRTFVDFVKEVQKEYPFVNAAYCDSAESVLIRGLKKACQKAQLAISVKNAEKGPIIDRIRFGTTMFSENRFFILSSCTEVIDAYENAVWDEKHEDTRLDDGSTNIDSLDASEYSQEPFIKDMIDIGRIA